MSIVMTTKREIAHKVENRAQELIVAAYRLIAEKGFEGLRTREIADQIGINHATLHHYFPTKEALVQAVALYVTQRIGRITHLAEGTPPERLRSHLHLLKQKMQEEPDLFIALNEIKQRALRDDALYETTEQCTEAWHQVLVAILEDGVQRGDWPQNLDAEAVASAIIALMNSINVRLSPKRADQAVRQLERWLLD
jgi:AcrR family transcriptional regulator